MTEPIIGYKLFRKRRDGTLGPLFINRTQRIPLGKWLWAQTHPTKGFAVRHGWHAVPTQEAPHLRQGGDRVWCKVELRNVHTFQVPGNQGGKWLLAKRLRVLEVLEDV